MKKWVIILLLIMIVPVAEAQYTGAYGEYFQPMDTVRYPLTVHDNTGLAQSDADTIVVTRYYNGLLVDSLLSASTRGAGHAQVDAQGSAGSGRYIIKFRAAETKDSIGQYVVFVRVSIGTDVGITKFTYQVLRGNGLNALFDVQFFLGAADDGYRVLYPVAGRPKDSVQYYGIFDPDNNGLDAGDTTFVSTVHFYHSNSPAILDSSKIIYHYGDP